VSDFGVCPLSRVDVLVTDAAGTERDRETLARAHVELTLTGRS